MYPARLAMDIQKRQAENGRAIIRLLNVVYSGNAVQCVIASLATKVYPLVPSPAFR